MRLQPGCALCIASTDVSMLPQLVIVVKTFVKEIIEQKRFKILVLLVCGSNVAQKYALRYDLSDCCHDDIGVIHLDNTTASPHTGNTGIV